MIRRYVSRLHSVLISLPLTFWILCGGTFINRLGMLIKPFLAIYLTSARHLPSDQVGLIVSLPGLGSIIASALIGILADRFSRKHLLVFGLLLSAALLLPIAFALSPLILALLVLVWSIINEGPGRLSRMLVLDIVKPEQRRQAVSLLRVAINVGLAASTAVGGVIAALNFLPLFILDAGTTVIFALLLAFRLPATVRPATEATSSEKQPALNVLSIFTPLRDQAFLKVWLSTLLAYMIFSQLFTTFATYLIQIGGSTILYGSFMTLSAALVIVEFPLMIALSHVPGPRMMALGCLIAGLGAGACGFISIPLWLIVPVLAFSLAGMLVAPSFDSIAVELAPAEKQGSYQGTLWLANGLGSTFGPALGGLLLHTSSFLCWMVFLLVGLTGTLIARTIPWKR